MRMVQIITVSAPTAAYVAAAHQALFLRPVERPSVRKALRELRVEPAESGSSEQTSLNFSSPPPLAFICQEAKDKGGRETVSRANQAYEDV
jgi:hypothetical protein